MAAIKTKGQVQELKNYISKLYLQGFSFARMEYWLKENTHLTLTRKMCKVYVDKILAEWHAERVEDVDKLITAELMGLNNIEYEAMQAWELSKKDKTKSVTRKRGKVAPAKRGNAKGDIETTNIEQYDEVVSGVGDPRFLEIAKDCRLQRLQYLTKGTFSARDENNTTINVQQIIEVGITQRVAPAPEIQQINVGIVENPD